MKLRLNPFLLRHTMLFLAPPGEGGGGGGGTPPAAPPPAAPPAGGDGGDDIMSFEPPDPGAVARAIADDNDPPPSPDPAPKPPKAGDPPPAPPKPGEPPKPGGEPPAKQLREELDTVKKERDELKATLEKGDPRLVAAEAAVKEKETEIADARKTITDYERKLLMANPAVTKKLQDFDAKYDGDADKFFRGVTEIDNAGINALVREYAKLPFGTPQYKEARAAFEKLVNERLGGTDETEARKLERVIDFVEHTHDFVTERRTLQTEVEQSASKLMQEHEQTEWKSKKKWLDDGIKAAMEVPEGLEKTDPWHPKIAIKKFVEGLGDAAGEWDKGVPEFVQIVFGGIPPRSEADYAGMTPAQIKASQAAESEKYEKARTHGIDVMFTGLRAMRLFPSLVKEVQRLTAKVKEKEGAIPPDPAGGGGGGGGGADDDLKTFAPPDLTDVKFQ